MLKTDTNGKQKDNLEGAQEYNSKNCIHIIIMRLVKKNKYSELRDKYDCIVGWGAGKVEFEWQYNPFLYQLDYMIDNSKKLIGKTVCGMKISDITVLNQLKNKKVCFIIFPNIEVEITEQIRMYLDDFDIIVARLVEADNSNLAKSYSESQEDIVFLDTMRKLDIHSPYYLDIGVCHPVIRNNTYLLYERGYTEGILVEPNIDMCRLAREYRPDNTLIEAGVCVTADGEADSSIRYYKNLKPSLRGHNTFVYEVAKAGGFEQNYVEVPVININRILSDYCKRVPDIIDIDAEGMDLSIIKALDTNTFRIKLICIEECGIQTEMKTAMDEKGYIHFMSTVNNGIYIAKELMGK